MKRISLALAFLHEVLRRRKLRGAAKMKQVLFIAMLTCCIPSLSAASPFYDRDALKIIEYGTIIKNVINGEGTRNYQQDLSVTYKANLYECSITVRNNVPSAYCIKLQFID